VLHGGIGTSFGRCERAEAARAAQYEYRDVRHVVAFARERLLFTITLNSS